jgi:hypothetical protein
MDLCSSNDHNHENEAKHRQDTEAHKAGHGVMAHGQSCTTQSNIVVIYILYPKI